MKIKYLIGTIAFSMIAIFIAYSFTFSYNEQTSKTSSGYAIVELFTSEGCSSCPPADRAIADLLKRNSENVFILAYHVDYWNRLGWKDAFSKAEFSARQQDYAAHFSSESVYTPQVIINGSSEFVGSDENKLNETIAIDLAKNKVSDVKITAIKKNNTVTLSYDINEEGPVLLNIAFIQPEATTNVKNGENGGRILHHVNIVRDLKTFEVRGSGNKNLEIPEALTRLPFEVIAFTQSKKTFQLLGADKAIIHESN